MVLNLVNPVFFITFTFLIYVLHVALTSGVLRSQWSNMDVLLLRYSPEAVAVAFALIAPDATHPTSAVVQRSQPQASIPVKAEPQEAWAEVEKGSGVQSGAFHNTDRIAKSKHGYCRHNCKQLCSEAHTSANITFCWCCCSQQRFNGVSFTGGGCCRKRKGQRIQPGEVLMEEEGSESWCEAEAKLLLKEVKVIVGPWGSTRSFMDR